MKVNWTIIVAVLGLVLTGTTGFVAYNAGFASGQQNAQSVQREFFANRQGGQGQFGQGNPNAQAQGNNPNAQGGQNGQSARGNFGRPVAAGTVKSIQGNTLVVTEQNGTAVTVTIDAQTQIIKTVAGQASDIQPGMRIQVTSDQTATGSAPVSARLITIQAAGAQTQ